MKLKNVLIIAFIILTFIPIVIVSLLLYKSGFALSKESYTRNLTESINVQADYISQTLESNMIADYRFINRSFPSPPPSSADEMRNELLSSFQTYLEDSEDKISACLLLDQENEPIYTIGEKTVLDLVRAQLPPFFSLTDQQIVEFNLGRDTYSLGVITPIRDDMQVYRGSLISIYDKSYIFKIISSYYEIADTSTYLCRTNGDIINFRGATKDAWNTSIKQALIDMTFAPTGMIDMEIGDVPMSGYYKNIHNSPWYLVGFVDHTQIHTFTNQFIWVYICIIVLVLILDVLLSVYFSQRVVAPINGLIYVMNDYPNSFENSDLECHQKNGYFETRYLATKFFSLMKTIMLVQHNFEGVYQLYQSSAMDDTNIDIDVKSQTIHSNKNAFQTQMMALQLPDSACIVERFTRCFCDKDQRMLMQMLENMRDEHLSVTREAEVFTPYFNQKWFHTLIVPMYEDDRLSRLFIQLRDISSFKKQEIKSSEQAKLEPLTGLFNRAGFTDFVNQVLHAQSAAKMHGLLFIDMNDFKLVNDTFGHSAGDDLLCAVGDALRDAVGADDLASRFGGDEFAVFLPHTSIEAVQAMKSVLVQRLVFPFQSGELSFTVSASIGFAIWEHTAPSTLEELLKQADDDMYQVKRDLKCKRNSRG